MDQVKLRRPVVPGDQLVLVAEAVRVRSRTGQCHCVAMVDERIAAEAELRFMLVDDDRV
jgi:3-hydroxymyristoyl/3-hydroxydecanoyl-(acyl carrier protein) dehydratase